MNVQNILKLMSILSWKILKAKISEESMFTQITNWQNSLFFKGNNCPFMQNESWGLGGVSSFFFFSLFTFVCFLFFGWGLESCFFLWGLDFGGVSSFFLGMSCSEAIYIYIGYLKKIYILPQIFLSKTLEVLPKKVLDNPLLLEAISQILI